MKHRAEISFDTGTQLISEKWIGPQSEVGLIEFLNKRFVEQTGEVHEHDYVLQRKPYRNTT